MTYNMQCAFIHRYRYDQVCVCVCVCMPMSMMKAYFWTITFQLTQWAHSETSEIFSSFLSLPSTPYGNDDNNNHEFIALCHRWRAVVLCNAKPNGKQSMALRNVCTKHQFANYHVITRKKRKIFLLISSQFLKMNPSEFDCEWSRFFNSRLIISFSISAGSRIFPSRPQPE